MSLRIYIPRDTTALALGADGIATALTGSAASRGLTLELVRNGSRGAFWLEPLLEVEYEDQRLAFGPVQLDDVESLLDAIAGDPKTHPRYVGLVDDIPYLAEQQRLTFARAGVGTWPRRALPALNGLLVWTPSR